MRVYITLPFILVGLLFCSHSFAEEALEDTISYEQSKELYRDNCASCHGKKGNAKTLMGRMLKPKPKAFQSVLSDPSMNDEKLFSAISDGKPDTAMRAFNTDLSEDEIKAVITYIKKEFED